MTSTEVKLLRRRAAFLAATAVEQLAVTVGEAKKAAVLLAGKPGRVQVLLAADLVHASIYDVQAAEHADADSRVMEAGRLFVQAVEACLIGPSVEAVECIRRAVASLKTGIFAYDQAHALLMKIDERR